MKCLMVVLVINLLVFLYLIYTHNLFSIDQYVLSADGASHYHREDAQHVVLAKEVTVIIREFEDFENRVNETVKNFKWISPYMNVIIVSDNIPYPPLELNFSQTIHFVNLQLQPMLENPTDTLRRLITTPYTLFIPDGTNITRSKALLQAVKNMKTRKLIKALAIPIGYEKLTCPGMDVHLRSWSVDFTNFVGGEGMCDYVQGNHALLMSTSDLFELTSPFERPLYVSLYMQLTLRRWKTGIYSGEVFMPKTIFKDFRSEWKHKHMEELRLENTMRKFEIKKVSYDKQKVIYYGCSKDTERCFGTVVNNMPEFLYREKWTPPCCLKAVRETAIHVFTMLNKCSARYWLEGGSLLGAARQKDIIPWDYDVDIGVYKEDLEKCEQFITLTKRNSFTDEAGFHWEKATEGEFFRVHYSVVNRNHVDIFPFYPKSGIMTKNTWFKTHRQDREFPEHYLKPLTKVEFIGMNVSAPNNIRQFLEYKFGKGVIENPRFPNSDMVVGG
ncbi:fukutin-related protein-like [Pecten maximus]|uniref:fukutin-related protein-like n=1 Tax=Pecten maximus TaxID=6579 RepID=UPI0014587654|nr:fukutin-related protein-like [Pecten maximus]